MKQNLFDIAWKRVIDGEYQGVRVERQSEIHIGELQWLTGWHTSKNTSSGIFKSRANFPTLLDSFLAPLQQYYFAVMSGLDQ